MNPTSQDKIERFKRILEETTTKKSLDKKYADQEIKDGDTIIRILPNQDPNKNFFVKSAFHRIMGDYYNCPKETKKGEKCPICEYVNKLYKSTNITDLEIAKEFKKTRRYYYNVVIRGNEDKGVRILTSGIKLFERVIGACANPEVGDITDINEGYDFRVNKRMKDGYWNYDLSDASRKPSILTADQAKAKEWLVACYDLEKEIKLLSYDELKKVLSDAIQQQQQTSPEALANVEQKVVQHVTAPKPAAPHTPPAPVQVDDDIDEEIETFRKNLENIQADGKK
jgi:hypothetical protein